MAVLTLDSPVVAGIIDAVRSAAAHHHRWTSAPNASCLPERSQWIFTTAAVLRSDRLPPATAEKERA
jgi:hypothetical protein